MAATLRAWFEMRPLAAPDQPFPPRPTEVVAVAHSLDRTAELRITRSSRGPFSFHFMAWANFVDAGGGLHHGWHEFYPERALVADSFETAATSAFEDARLRGIELGALERVDA